MTNIAINDFPTEPAPDGAASHASHLLWTQPVHGLLPRIQAEMQARQAHPSRTLVLLPYAQLLPLACRLWAQSFPDGFAPRFETTMNWCGAAGGVTLGATDIAFDLASDLLMASALLHAGGLAAQRDALAPLLVQAAYPLAPLAAACNPRQRPQWAQLACQAGVLGMESPMLATEATVARIAVQWAAQSAYASDVLFDPDTQAGWDCVVAVQGFTADPLLPALLEGWGERLVRLSLLAPGDSGRTAGCSGGLAWHPCHDAEDEAQRTAACAVRHVAAGCFPVALVSTDRALTRRVRSMLEAAGVQIRDENGWKLSTSHAGAQVMALLKAAVWNASSDAVLAWLKGAPAFLAQASALETALRIDQSSVWRGAAHGAALQRTPSAVALYQAVDGVREGFQGRRTLTAWLDVLRCTLRDSGLWEPLQVDAAGAKVIATLRLAGAELAAWTSTMEQALWWARRMDLAAFTHWVSQALEGARFSPAYPDHEQVVILPMSQMLARPFAAVVLTGCDEVRLNPSPEVPGGWTAPQRAALGLPSRDDLQAALVSAWQHALQTPYCDVLWRCSDDSGETLQPSALVQRVQAQQGTALAATDPRVARLVAVAPVYRPRPVGQLLPVRQLSASGYEDLRNCPYRFFAMRQLGLQTVDELDSEVGKRDFGLWLHDVLKRFHETVAAVPPGATVDSLALLDAASQAATQAMGLGEGEFLPFAATWPTVRDGYLRWLAQHQATGAAFFSAESTHAQGLGSVRLVGRIDRIDRLGDGSCLVLDYKTEGAAKTAARIKDPLEDTQIAFYAALLPHDTLQGAYVNVGERETRAYEQCAVVSARDALVDGILQDLARIGEGAALDALGEGTTCDFCPARGLCRKDFWQ